MLTLPLALTYVLRDVEEDLGKVATRSIVRPLPSIEKWALISNLRSIP